MWDEIIYPFPNGTTIEVWEWISNFISHFIMDIITNPCQDSTKAMSVKGAPGVMLWKINKFLFSVGVDFSYLDQLNVEKL